MKNILLGSALLLIAACSGDPRISDLRAEGETNVPRCMDLCAGNFQMCTTKYPGDYSACSDSRRECDSECRTQAAEKREEGTNKAVEPVEPIESKPTPKPNVEDEVPMAQPE